MGGNLVWRDQMEKICSAVQDCPSLVELDLQNCFRNGLGDEMMTSLLTTDGLRLETLVMSSNGITSSAIQLLSDFLANDPPLKILDLDDNHLNDHDALTIANALRSNTLLRRLDLFNIDDITEAGTEVFRRVLYDDSSLNSVADSNHSCEVAVHVWDSLSMNHSWNMNDLREERGKNRGRKIYMLLSDRNRSMSNVQHFDDIDVEVLPNMVEAVQKYANMLDRSRDGYYCDVKSLSIVYEAMRKWDKAFPLYKSLGSGKGTE